LLKLEQVNTKIKGVQDAIDKGLKPSFVQQTALVQKLRGELVQLSESAPGYAAKFENFKKATATLNQMKDSLSGVEKAQRSWMNDAKTVAFGVLIGNTVQSAIQSLTGYLSGILTGNAKLSDSLSDIEKSTGLSSEAVKRLNSELSSINTRTKTAELREIAVGLGQIGEAANKANVAAIDKIVVALGDEFGGGAREITTTLSVLRNNLQDIKTGDYATDVSHIGNALNTLGAEGLATAPVVTDIANRIAGIGQTFGLTSGQILGTAATFQELGIETERGSTAITKLFQKIGAEPEKFAKVAGISIKEFKELVNRDMLGAFDAVAAGAKKAGSNNIVFSQILKELDADGSGAGEVLSKLGANHELLAKKVDTATNALKSQSSITEEFDKKNNNLAANLEKLGKIIDRLFTNSALTNFFSNLISGLTDTLTPAKSLTEQFNEQLNTVFNLETKTRPLIDRYDELSKKSTELGGTTKLSKQEQGEMKTIIEQIAETLPSAITEVDKYGKAIGISTNRVREFITEEKNRLKYVNAEVLNSESGKLKKLQDEAKALEGAVNQITKTGKLVITSSGNSRTGEVSQREASEKEIGDIMKKYRTLQDNIQGATAEIKRLNGDALQEQIDSQKKIAEAKKKQEEEEDKKRKTSPATNPLGNNDADKKAMEERLRLREKYYNLIQGLNEKIAKNEGDELDAAYAKINNKLEDNIKLIDELLNKGAISAKEATGAINLAVQDAQAASDEAFKVFTDKLNKQRGVADIEIALKPVVKPLDLNKLVKDAQVAGEAMTASLNRAAQIRSNNALNNGSNQERLTEQLRLLESEKQQRLNVANITISEIQAIEEEFRLKQEEAIKNSYLNQVNTILSFAQQGLAVLDQFNQARTQRENAAFEKERQVNERRRSDVKKLVDTKVITEIEGRKRLAELDKTDNARKEALEKKQQERQKKIAIAQALINGALGVTAVLASVPGPLDVATLGVARILQIAFTLATTAAQIGAISSQKFEKGGIAQGGRHSEGGIKLVDTKSKKVVGEMEGGEPYMIFSRNTYSNNRQVIDALLDSSMNRNGAPIQPLWNRRTYRPLDYTGISATQQKIRMFENGGITNTNTAAATASDNSASLEILKETNMVMFQLMQTTNALNERLSKPIQSHVVLQQLYDTQELDTTIKTEAGAIR
jgi:TP901 family phage tail tape measure protein